MPSQAPAWACGSGRCCCGSFFHRNDCLMGDVARASAANATCIMRTKPEIGHDDGKRKKMQQFPVETMRACLDAARLMGRGEHFRS